MIKRVFKIFKFAPLLEYPVIFPQSNRNSGSYLPQGLMPRGQITAFTIIILTVLLFSGVFNAHAQNPDKGRLTLTVIPPLLQINLAPGDVWSGAFKVINHNPYEVPIYVSPVNFEPQGESGLGRFIPLEKDDKHSLAGWIEIERGPIVVEPEKSQEIKMTIRIPPDASPGGHYAALLVGTQPSLAQEEGTRIGIASFISSLVFLRVSGEVVEDGDIIEFSTDKSFYEKPEAAFTLRFKNKGNVHLQPRGLITIYNMWGRERGRIVLNESGGFGNVLPQSVRKFSFVWKGEENIFEAGRYKALAALQFGKEAKQNVSAITYFWIIPVFPLAGIAGGTAVLIFIIIWGIRAYIRRALRLERESLLGAKPTVSQQGHYRRAAEVLIRPLRQEMQDIRSLIHEEKTIEGKSTDSLQRAQGKARDSVPVFKLKPVSWLKIKILIKKYGAVIVFFAALYGIIAVTIIYFREVLIPSRTFEIRVTDELKNKLQR
jgi:hypothetical protein